MTRLKEKHATAFVFTIINSHFKTVALSALVAVSLMGAAYAAYAALSDTRSYTEEIQRTRVEFFLLTCRETNARNEATIAKLDMNLKALPPGKRSRESALERESTVALIDAAIPRQNCEAFVKRLDIGKP